MKKTFASAALCVGLLGACDAPEQRVGGESEAGVAPALTIPVGSCAGCTAITVNFASGDVAVTGPWGGTVTLSTNGDAGATAALVFQGLATETVAFSPTSSTSAGFEPLDASGRPAVTAGSLALVGDMLLISTYGGDGDGTDISAFYSCRYPRRFPERGSRSARRRLGPSRPVRTERARCPSPGRAWAAGIRRGAASR